MDRDTLMTAMLAAQAAYRDAQDRLVAVRDRGSFETREQFRAERDAAQAAAKTAEDAVAAWDRDHPAPDEMDIADTKPFS